MATNSSPESLYTSGCATIPETAPALAERYFAVRSRTETLCAPLSPEDAQVQSMPDASPAKWHLAHTTWFFETFLLERLPGYRPVDASYRVLFNSYYNAVGPRHPRPARGLLTRPTLDEVKTYRRSVDESVVSLLTDARTLDQSAHTIIVLGLHHEQQHQELLLTDAKHALAQNPFRPAYHDRVAPGDAVANAPQWIAYEGGLQEIGHEGAGFAFDNEQPCHRVYLAPYELASRPVTNGEYLEFIEDGGYERAELWLSDGLAWIREHHISAPLYWERLDDAWHRFTLAGLERMRFEAPVSHVSHYEANAYARWAGARLPTEHEWEAPASQLCVEGNFADDGWFDPGAAASENGSASQMFGDVWEWTASAYLPYPGYHEAAGALGEYNGKFMSGQMVLRGGSCATPRSHMRPTYRNFFPPNARWQFSGLRLARDL
jgi:ergothioneine biosynthesis protein EgtB